MSKVYRKTGYMLAAEKAGYDLEDDEVIVDVKAGIAAITAFIQKNAQKARLIEPQTTRMQLSFLYTLAYQQRTPAVHRLREKTW